MRIVFTGGGTVGHVMPLLAVKDELDQRGGPHEYIWIGTDNGPEREVVARDNILFYAVSAGKWRRYFSWRNFIDPLRILRGYFQAKKILRDFAPDAVLCAGGYVGVPVIRAARKLKIKTFIHQQDLRPGLANKIMSHYADVITVAFEKSLADFPKGKTTWIGNPVRASMKSATKEEARTHFKLESGLPTVLAFGGSLGADFINQLIYRTVGSLAEICQIIHIAGRGQLLEWQNPGELGSRYHGFEYLFEDMPLAYAAADLVVCRAGLATLTEIAVLRKPAIVIPIPGNQQEDNAAFFQSRNAVIMAEQSSLSPEEFYLLIKDLLARPNSLERLSLNIAGMMPDNAAVKLADMVSNPK